MRLQLTVPRNTPPTSPLSIVGQFMEAPFISRVSVTIPKGHMWLTGCQLRVGRRHSVLPEPGSSTEWLTDDGTTITRSVHIEIEPPLYSVELRGYNSDDTYPHSFYVDIE